MNDQQYLEPGFDPKKLTITRLRSILLAHNINYPSSAKKAELIELFKTALAPQASTILAEQASVKRTTKGIKDVSTGRVATGESDDEYDSGDELAQTSRKS